MNDPESSVTPTDESAAAPTSLSKPLSWQRAFRTSCDSCKQMKIKCQRDGNESCARCIGRGLSCTTTPVERKRRRTANKNEASLDEMEDRIKRMESTISSSLQHGTEAPVEGKQEEQSSSEKIEIQAELSNQLSNLVIDPSGSPNFIGWASGFSFFSPQELRWISEKVGDRDELAKLVRIVSKSDYDGWGRAGVADLWYPRPLSQHSPLPSKDLALQYVNHFFSTFNNVFPVVSQKVFNAYFERQYSTNPPAGTAWYALFNAVLCLGSIGTEGEREKHTRSSCLVDYTSVSQETGVKYFRNASSCFHELFFMEANLMAMQAITLMLFITTSSPNPQPAYVMTSAAGNLSNTLGLHRTLSGFGLAPEVIEERRNTFWVFYLTEKAICLNLGRPSVINDDDIAVDLPPKKAEPIQSPSGIKLFDIFQDQITLAIIRSRIYSELYSASSQTKPGVARMEVLAKLDKHLQRWRDAIPVDIRPEHPIKCSDDQYPPVAMMHFIYLDTIILLHRLASRQESFVDSKTADIGSHNQRPRLTPRAHTSQLLCLAAARKSIQLLDTYRNNNLQNQNITWMALYYPLSASLVLIANILSNPQDQHAASDIHLMSLLNSFITNSVRPGTSFATTPTLGGFNELYGIATRLVAKAPPQSSKKMKWTSQYDSQITHDSTPSYSETDIPEPRSPPLLVHGGQQNPLAGLDYSQSTSTTTSAKTSQDLPTAGNDPLELAPFVLSDSSQLDYLPGIYDSMLSPTSFEWDADSMWTATFAPDQWDPADLTGSNQEPDIE